MTTGIEFGAAIQGDYEAEVRKGRRRVEAGLQYGVFQFTAGVHRRWQEDVYRSRLANSGQVSNTVRLRTWVNDGMNPAALTWTSWPKVMAAFERGADLRAKSGKFLLIPNPDVWPHRRIRAAGRRHQRDASGSAELKAGIARFGPLRFVPSRSGKAALLVADVRYSEKTGRYSRLSVSARSALDQRGFHVKNAATIVVFFLVKQARIPRLLRGAQIRERARRAAPSGIDRLYLDYMNRTAPGGS